MSVNIDNLVLCLTSEREFYSLIVDEQRKKVRNAQSISPIIFRTWYYVFRSDKRDKWPLITTEAEGQRLGIALYEYYKEEFCLPDLEPVTETTTQPTEEINMSTVKTVEVKTYVRGVELITMSDQQLYDVISSIENQITKLESIKTQPEKLKAQIGKLKAEALEVANLVDSR